MNNNKTLEELQKRASEQSLLTDIPFPKLFLFISRTFGTHPWRAVIPFAFLLTLFFHLFLGHQFDNAILWLFGGL